VDTRGKIFRNDADRGIADPASGLVPGRRGSKELNPKMVGKIRRWLGDCLNKHPSCPRSCTPELPRRVLDVGTDISTVRLHQSLKDEKAQYASLSYCWGDSGKQITTTNSNLDDHMLALPRHLPKTISDAIEVCRKVRIRYLWIDALCIIQDNSTDKLEQIAKMGSIYKSSTVTIVAASAERVTDGFLSNEKPIETIAQLPIFIDNSTCGTVYLRIHDSDYIYSSEEPISQRAWTLQELLLSPRALIFDSSQVTLKCIEHAFQPVLDTYVNFEFGCCDLPVSVFGLLDKQFAWRDTQDSREYYLKHTQDRKWKEIIQEYSQRNLTFFDDRLPALAGIATELAKSWNDIYLAGFWKKTITQHLGWYRSESAFRSTRNSKNFEGVDGTNLIGSPSWSWVTAPFSVSVQGCEYPDTKLIDSGVLLESQKSPFGKVKDAFIALEARVLKASDLDLSMKFKSWPSPPYDNSIGLDFEAPKLDSGNCRLVHLGHGRDRWMFLVVEKSLGGRFRRVGYTELSSWKPEWKNLVSSAKREITVIE
jgi:Heterokaryon incompatibility protein (HET)